MGGAEASQNGLGGFDAGEDNRQIGHLRSLHVEHELSVDGLGGGQRVITLLGALRG